MTAPTTQVLDIYRENAIQTRRIIELAEVAARNIARQATDDPSSMHQVGLAIAGAAMTLMSEFTSPAVIAELFEVPDTEADLIRVLTANRNVAAQVLRTLTDLFVRFGWDLP